MDFQLQVLEFPSLNPCHFLEDRHIGSEDLTKITEDIVVSMSNDNISMWEFEEGLGITPPGYIWFFYLEKNKSVKPQIQNLPEKFVLQPHGIYYDTENQTLYVLNHPYQGKGDRLEQFYLDLNDLDNIVVTYVRSLQLPTYLNGVANDIIKISEKEFLVTQWISEPDNLNSSSRDNLDGKLRKLKMVFNNLFDQKQTMVHSCVIQDNDEFECVQTSARGNVVNGITWNKKNTVLVADSANRGRNVIHEYQLDLQAERENRLVFKQYIEVTGHPDNVEYDQFLDQYTTGGMVKIYQYFIYLHNQKKIHPNLDYPVQDFFQFMDIIKEENGQFTAKNVLLRSDVMRGCSTGIQYKDKLILGSFTEKTVSICKYDGSVNNQKPYKLGIVAFYKKLFGI